jgi:hypothetical protein
LWVNELILPVSFQDPRHVHHLRSDCCLLDVLQHLHIPSGSCQCLGQEIQSSHHPHIHILLSMCRSTCLEHGKYTLYILQSGLLIGNGPKLAQNFKASKFRLTSTTCDKMWPNYAEKQKKHVPKIGIKIQGVAMSM